MEIAGFSPFERVRAVIVPKRRENFKPRRGEDDEKTRRDDFFLLFFSVFPSKFSAPPRSTRQRRATNAVDGATNRSTTIGVPVASSFSSSVSAAYSIERPCCDTTTFPRPERFAGIRR